MKARLMALFGTILLTALLLPGTSQAATSVAVSKGNASYGYCTNQPNKQVAESCAMQHCKKYGAGCHISFTDLRPGYGALAVAPTVFMFETADKDQAEAIKKVTQACAENGATCKIADTWRDQ